MVGVLLAAGMGCDHNAMLPEDANGSGDVTPLDALVVINEIARSARNQGSSASTPSGAQSTTNFHISRSTMADVNADGLLDLAIANLGPPDNAATASVSVLLNNSASPGSFVAATNYATDYRSESVAVGDLNGDGKADLAVANAGAIGNTGSVSVLFQNPGAPGAFLPAVNRPGTSQPLGVAIADLNGDSLLDIALADDGVRILFQIPGRPGNFQSAILVGS